MNKTEPSRNQVSAHNFLGLLAGAASSSNPALACGLAIGIFLIDTIAPPDIAVAVLYASVVFLSINFRSRHGVVITALACALLTILSFLLSHGASYTKDELGDCLVSLLAIGITALLAARIHLATERLSERANLLNLTHDAVFVRDMGGAVTYWNRAAEQLYGWSSAEANGKVFRQLTKPTFPAPTEAIMDELLSDGRWEGELFQKKRSGEPIIVASRWSLQRDEGNRPLAILETNTDISGHKQAEAALEQAQTELAHIARVTTLGELTASIAHEINQPLAAISIHGQACLRFLNREVPELNMIRGAITRMISDSDRAIEVIGRLRALAKGAPLQMARLDINDVIEEVILLLRREISDHAIALRLDLTSGLAPVIGDRIQLEQVILNLVMNGIDAMAPITDRQRELLIRSAPHESGQVTVAVQDSGVGIDPENADQLFNAFFTTKSQGLGMGLSICRSIIEAHDGRLWASANAGPDATFQFTLSSYPEPALT